MLYLFIATLASRNWLFSYLSSNRKTWLEITIIFFVSHFNLNDWWMKKKILHSGDLNNTYFLGCESSVLTSRLRLFDFVELLRQGPLKIVMDNVISQILLSMFGGLTSTIKSRAGLLNVITYIGNYCRLFLY